LQDTGRDTFVVITACVLTEVRNCAVEAREGRASPLNVQKKSRTPCMAQMPATGIAWWPRCCCFDGGSGVIAFRYLVARDTILQASGGVLWRVADDRLRIGAEAELLTSNGYFTGKGGPFVEVSMLRHARVMPFLRDGRFAGEDTSWIAGGGIDVWMNRHGGARVTLQDAFRSSSYDVPAQTFHEPSFQIGWVWR
jgi:hypothetical protein